SSGNYIFEIAGLNSGQFDVLDIDGNAFFTGGNFKFDFIDGFIPSVGDHWDFLVADSLSGLGTVNFTYAGLGDGLGVDLNTEGGKISLTVITAVPEPETYAMLLAGLGLMSFMVYRRKLKEAA
ncbi:MAG: PEP-CTERM sorting domain-containing protein, partial [Nitrosomonas sp.]|uniref:PEP-CTERM sorting domain-containing protein n=1 Tax=Nitrosomonas sp. TaxID=42353 RepID=UPI0025E05584